MIGLRLVADHLEREIGFHRRAHVEGAVLEQRPAVVLALDAAQIIADAGFEHRVDRLAEVMPQQDIFGGNGGVGFKLEQPMAVGPLAGEQRLRRRVDMPVEIERVRPRRVCLQFAHIAHVAFLSGILTLGYFT